MDIKRIVTIILISFGSLAAAAQRTEIAKSDPILRAGLAKIDITPAIPVKLYGYASRKAYSEGVHDTLYARVLVLEISGKKIVMVSSDLGSYGSEVFPVFQQSIIEKFQLGESELFLTTIHSHSSPVLSVNSETGDPNNIKYTNELLQKLVKVIDEAIKNMKPVLVATGSGSSPVGANRREMRTDGSITLGRNPYGVTDKEVQVIRISDTTGDPLGVVYDYATHSTSLGPANLMISGDILGLSAQFVEKILGSRVIAPVFAGASGNIDPWYRILPGFNSEPGWIPEPVLLSTLLGEEIIHILRDTDETNSVAKISSGFETILCPRKKTDNASPDIPLDSTVPVNITVARLGDDIAFAGFSVEMLTEIGMEIKRASPFRYTFIITHCNGSSGYLAPAELYKEGGYEISSTRFEIGSSDMVVRKTLRMLYDLK